MQSLVVFFALAAVACGSYIPLAQPAHYPAVVLDPHGRPLDTAEVIHARAVHLQAKALEPAHLGHAAIAVTPIAHSAIVAGPAVYAGPAAAVSHQSRVDVRTSPAVVAHAAPVSVWGAHAAAPVWGAHASPLLGYSAHGLAGAGHYLHKRSLGYGAWSTPLIAPSAVSHQSRVDVVSSPAVVSHAVAAPVYAHAAPVYAHATPLVAHAAPVVAIAPAAVSHQSRVDVRTSPAISVVATAPVWGAHAAPLWGQSSLGLAGAGHYLHKRSLGYGAWSAPLIAPSAVSHQSRVDVVSSPAVVAHAVAAPVYAHAAPAAVSHQSRVDVRTSPAISVIAAAPVVHSYISAAPLAHAGSWAHGW